MKFSTVLSLTLAGAVSAAPSGCKARTPTSSAATPAATEESDSSCSLSVTTAQISTIAPATSSCTTTGGQCSTAETAAQWITKAACQYGVTKNEMMAVIALISFESGGFVAKINNQALSDPADHAGQGTANMQSAAYNFAYANSLPDVKSKIAQFASIDAMSYDQRNTILLPAVTPDAYNFGSGFWYLTQAEPEKCAAPRQALNSDLSTGFTSFITDCVQTTITQERTDVLNTVIKAFSGY